MYTVYKFMQYIFVPTKKSLNQRSIFYYLLSELPVFAWSCLGCFLTDYYSIPYII